MKYAYWSNNVYTQLENDNFQDYVDSHGKDYRIYKVTQYTDAGMPIFDTEPVVVDRAKELAEAHWGYIEELLCVHGSTDVAIDVIGFHYVSAFVHGYKHALEDMTDANTK